MLKYFRKVWHGYRRLQRVRRGLFCVPLRAKYLQGRERAQAVTVEPKAVREAVFGCPGTDSSRFDVTVPATCWDRPNRREKNARQLGM